MKKILVMAGLVLLAGGSMLTVQAAEFMVPDKDGNSGVITVGSTEEHKNLYVAGGSVIVNGKILGDLYAAGGNVDVAGDVEQDAVVAGGNVTIDSKVGGDVRAAGGSVKINGPVGGDLLAAGGTLYVSEKSGIGGDAALGGGEIQLDAPVMGNVKVGGNNIVINSHINGTLTVGSTNKNQKIIFGSKAEVSGAFVIYGSEASITKDAAAKVPEPEYRPVSGREHRGGVARIFAGAVVIKILASIIALLLVLRLFPRRAQEAINSVLSDPWSNLGIGFVGLIAVPVAAIILLLVLVGYYVALLLLAWYAFMLMLAALIGALFLGAWIVKLLTKKPELKADWQAAVIGVVVLAALAFIPVVGWIVCFVLFCMGLGALLRMAKIDMKQNQ